ncbi:hypothetical protein BDZ89DRAFT_1116005 [Hymenopellis radicata]|nr:hypothetical protein BDZ89DRAFT_1116005 [Hymenopellis radicata]
MAEYTTIDDRDSAVVRTGLWFDDEAGASYNSTLSSSTHEGDFLTVTFTGTEIIVYGTYNKNSGGVVTSYAIDNGLATPVTHSASGDSPQYRQQFWDSGTLDMAEHHLDLTMVHVNTLDRGFTTSVWIDYFNVTSVPATNTSSTTVTPSTSGSGSSSTALSGSTSGAHSSSPPVGAIVGGIIGGVALVIIAIALWLWYRARKRRALLYNPPTTPGVSSSFRDPAHTSTSYQPPDMAQALGAQSSPYFATTSSATALAPGYPQSSSSQTDVSSSGGSSKGAVHLTVMGLAAAPALACPALLRRAFPSQIMLQR